MKKLYTPGNENRLKAVPGSGMPHDENDLDSNENLQSLYELIGVLP